MLERTAATRCTVGRSPRTPMRTTGPGQSSRDTVGGQADLDAYNVRHEYGCIGCDGAALAYSDDRILTIPREYIQAALIDVAAKPRVRSGSLAA